MNNFTDWHLGILKYLDDPNDWFKSNDIIPQEMMMGTIGTNLFQAFPALKQETELLSVIWKDLYGGGFISIDGFNTMMSGGSALSNRTTKIGSEFLEFIIEQ